MKKIIEKTNKNKSWFFKKIKNKQTIKLQPERGRRLKLIKLEMKKKALVTLQKYEGG